MKKVPVLFVIFSREEVSLKSMESIKEYRPEKLYIAADGPRANKPGEFELCENTRRSVLNMVDWDCEVITLFRDENLGCTQAVSGAISWFFSNEEYGIIIEDDCIIHSDFYTLCESMLPHYKDEEKVMLVTAQNHTPNLKRADQLVFTNGCYIWGWASWRRAWQKMDMSMEKWPEYKFRKLVKNFGFLYACYMLVFWNKDYRDPKHGSWDTRWFFSVLVNKGLCLTSNVNLSINAGIEIGGEHYEKGDVDPYKHLSFGSIKWPVKLPVKLDPSRKKMLAERKEFIRIRMIGLKKKVRKKIGKKQVH
ncbi:MAG: hypothetical protein LBQ60_12720 [Bacteroidales bacterium]|jgi:hypothetical protein|nr:hypothetical protein [Bacteroidales bacterium]